MRNEEKPAKRLDERVGLIAVTLALRTSQDPGSVASKLVRDAGHNRMALRRALARLLANNPSGLGPVGQRAAEALRLATAMVTDDRSSTRHF